MGTNVSSFRRLLTLVEQARLHSIPAESAGMIARFYFTLYAAFAALALFIGVPFLFAQKLGTGIIAALALAGSLWGRQASAAGHPERAMDVFAVALLVVASVYLALSQRIGVAGLMIATFLPVHAAVSGFDKALKLSIAFMVIAIGLFVAIHSGMHPPNLFPGGQVGDLLVTLLAIVVALAPIAVLLAALTEALGNAEEELTIRRTAESALLETTQRLADFSESASDWFWETDAEQRVTYVSEIAELGSDHFVAATKRWNEQLANPAHERTQAFATFQTVLDQRKAFRDVEIPLDPPGSQRIWFSLSAKPIIEAGKFLGYRGSATDITVSKQAEETTQRARAAAENASRAKSEFLAILSHEVRTPLNGVLGMASLLELELENVEQRTWLLELTDNAQSLLTMMDRIIDHTKLESQSVEAAHDPFQLKETLDSAVRRHQAKAAAKGLQLSFDCKAATAEALEGDGARLLQAVNELLDNAVRFTDHGEVSLTVRELDANESPAVVGDSRCWLRFEVKDSGCGIDPTHGALIFDAFTQADSSATRRIGGHGLGLAICRNIAALLGGRIEFTSTPGQGSSFVLLLPFARFVPG